MTLGRAWFSGVTGAQGRLKELLRYNLKSVRAYLLKEDFQQLWTYQSPTWAGKFLDTWCTTALRSRIEPMKKIARMCRRHRPLILNWFKAKKAISNGVVEGLNNKAKLTIRKILWFPISGNPRNGVISCAWQASRAKAYPRILLRSQYNKQSPPNSIIETRIIAITASMSLRLF